MKKRNNKITTYLNAAKQQLDLLIDWHKQSFDDWTYGDIICSLDHIMTDLQSAQDIAIEIDEELFPCKKQ